MKLPDNEIRDITKLLEEGNPLPDKYRFTLFGQERELELIWNGKINEVTVGYPTLEDDVRDRLVPTEDCWERYY